MEQLNRLSDIQEYTIKPLLRTVPGIADINESGGYERQFVVQPNPQALEAAGMTFTELADVIAANVANAGGGIINRGSEQFTIRAVGRANTLEELAELPVKFGAAVPPIKVQDVAEVGYGVKFRTGAATLNGGEAVIGTTMMLAGQNSREVAQRVKARIAEIQTKLPGNIEIRRRYDRSSAGRPHDRHGGEESVRGRAPRRRGALPPARQLARRAHRGTRHSALVSVRAHRHARALSGNSDEPRGGGLRPDHRRRSRHRGKHRAPAGTRQHELGRILTPEERTATVLAASKQVGSPMFFGVLIITIVYLPILALTGIEGKMFHPMAITVMLALGGALLVALTLMPVLCSILLRGKISEKENIIIRAAKALYRPGLLLALKLRYLVVLAAIALFVGSLLLFRTLGAEFTPKLDEGSITAMFYKPVGMSMDESLRSTSK